ncbi:ASCH domain-containing protein [Planctomicrobium sp. SH527]|uniref:ASCH domain-containing protein n=1 Tax=Planctomicrobium sp. SH527 TaxID=3448123 RepID=UPI003F5B637F
MIGPDEQQLGLSIQQPWAELILQGVKVIEIRNLPTRIRGRVYLYASKRFSSLPCTQQVCDDYNLVRESLPRGCIVGTIEVLDCRASRPEDAPLACVPPMLVQEKYSWLLGGAVRCPQLWPARYPPFGPWFYPFQRRGTSPRPRSRHGGT